MEDQKQFDDILGFTRQVLADCRIHSQVLQGSIEWKEDYDLGLRQALLTDASGRVDADHSLGQILEKNCPPSVLCHAKDAFSCEYIFLRLSNSNSDLGVSFLLVGPFTGETITMSRAMEFCTRAGIPQNLYDFMWQYYAALPFISDVGILKNLLSRLSLTIWGSREWKMLHIRDDQTDDAELTTQPPAPNLEAVELINRRYSVESEMMQAIAQGNSRKASKVNDDGVFPPLTQRIADSIRDQKNQLIIMNTLCRKAAEAGQVPPVYLDQISSRFAVKIESTNDKQLLHKMMHEMIHRYCVLVQSNSLKGYSEMIRKVLTLISMDLTADLSLRALAAACSVNGSYLSARFRQETGQSLTEYVNEKRIAHAIYILNSTNLPIQNIAVMCGIPDLNYFTRTFKKYKKMTPSEYRKLIQA